MASLAKKLYPGRFTGMSPKMAAIVQYIIGAHGWVTPEIVGLITTSDDMVLAQLKGDVGFNEFLGSRRDFNNNWWRLLKAAGLTKKEAAKANMLFLRATGNKEG